MKSLATVSAQSTKESSATFIVSFIILVSFIKSYHSNKFTAATVLTLRGSSYVSYRIYDWKDRVHSSMTRISLMFKTIYDDSVLFFASGESFRSQYIAASIKNNSVYVEM